jgi:hypothetical protein
MRLIPRCSSIVAFFLSPLLVANAQMPIGVYPSTAASDLATTLTVVSIAGGFVSNGSSSIVSIRSIDNPFVDKAYSPTGYDCMKRLQAHVINSTHLTVTTLVTQNAAPALLKVSMDNGTTWSNATFIRLTPLVEVAVGRRPYTAEKEGTLLVKVAGPPLLQDGASVQLSAALANPALHLVDGVVQAGMTSEVRYSLIALPSTVYTIVNVEVTIPRATFAGRPAATAAATIQYRKSFQRAPPPSNPNITVSVVDHTTKGMLLGRGAEEPWLPFLAVGWFNSAFTYPHQGLSDPTFKRKAVDPNLINGADRQVEWARKGVNLIR